MPSIEWITVADYEREHWHPLAHMESVKCEVTTTCGGVRLGLNLVGDEDRPVWDDYALLPFLPELPNSVFACCVDCLEWLIYLGVEDPR